MTMPASTRSLRYPCGAMISSTATFSVLLESTLASRRIFALGFGIIYLNGSARAQGAQRFVAADYDLVAVFQAIRDLNVSNSGDARLYRDEFGFLSADNENALNVCLLGVCPCVCSGRGFRGRQRNTAAVCSKRRFVDFSLGSYGKCLDWNGENVFLLFGLNPGGGGKPRAQ